MTAGLAGRIVRENRVTIVVLAVALAVNAAVTALVIYPMSAQVQAGEQSAAIAGQALRAAEHEYSVASGTMSAKNRATEDLRRFYTKVLPADMAGARRATYLMLSKIAQNAQLQTQRRTEEVPEARKQAQPGGSQLTRFAISMALKGEYENVRQFIRDIEAAGAFIVIDNVALAEGTERGSALMLTVELSTYYRMTNNGI